MYLGVIFQTSGSFKLAKKNLVKKQIRLLIQLEKNIANELSPPVLLKIFDALLKPIVNYSSEVTWKKGDDQAKVFQMNWYLHVHLKCKQTYF